MTRAAPLRDALDARLAALEPNAGWVVAFSGGPDSTCLLHLVRGLRPHAPLRAVHVDHGWHADSPRWAAHCVAVAAGLGVACEVVPVTLADQGGGGREARARAARRAVFADTLREGEVLLTAHHADDQAETVLLMALRGGGLPGLAAMPAVMPLGAGRLARPLLGERRAALAAWLAAHGIATLDDPSNADQSLDRNHLRASVFPLLETRWPGAVGALARVARHAADAAALAGELARLDLASVQRADGALAVGALRALEGARRRNLLRHWLAESGLTAPPAVAVARIEGEVLTAAHDRLPEVSWSGGRVRRWRDGLFVIRRLPELGAGPWAWDLRGSLSLPDGSRIQAEPGPGPGLALAPGTPVEVRLREGGERLRLAGARHSTTVKRFLQDLDIPPWQRERLPLIYHAGQLVAVADRALVEGWQGSPGLQLGWRPA